MKQSNHANAYMKSPRYQEYREQMLAKGGFEDDWDRQVKLGDNLLDQEKFFSHRWNDGDIMSFETREDGEWKTVSLNDILKDRRVVIFGLPGAFTPTCTTQQLPNFELNYEKFTEDRAIDEIYCLSVNDTFVMNAWFENSFIEKVKPIPDGNCELSMALGLDVDKSSLGFGRRSWRYAMVVNNGIVEILQIEDGFPANKDNPDPYEVSAPQNILSLLDAHYDLNID
jgi:peroxiredoxin